MKSMSAAQTVASVLALVALLIGAVNYRRRQRDRRMQELDLGVYSEILSDRNRRFSFVEQLVFVALIAVAAALAFNPFASLLLAVFVLPVVLGVGIIYRVVRSAIRGKREPPHVQRRVQFDSIPKKPISVQHHWSATKDPGDLDLHDDPD